MGFAAQPDNQSMTKCRLSWERGHLSATSFAPSVWRVFFEEEWHSPFGFVRGGRQKCTARCKMGGIVEQGGGEQLQDGQAATFEVAGTATTKRSATVLYCTVLYCTVL